MSNERGWTRRPEPLAPRLARTGFVAVCAIMASGCATKADIRDIQESVAESSRQQAQIIDELQRNLAITADSLQRGQSQGRVELQGTVLTRLNEIAGRLDRLEALVGLISNEVSTLRDEVQEIADRPAPVQFGTMPTDPGAARSGGGGESADDLINQAHQDYQDGSLATAKMEFEAFIEDFPGDPRVAEARYHRALILRDTDDPEVALTAFQEIPQLYPDSDQVPLAQFQIAELHIELGDPEDARDVLRRMIATYPGHALNGIATRLLREIGGDSLGPLPGPRS